MAAITGFYIIKFLNFIFGQNINEKIVFTKITAETKLENWIILCAAKQILKTKTTSFLCIFLQNISLRFKVEK